MNTPVSFELAKLLKDKGFDESCYYYWCNTTTSNIELHRLNNSIKQNEMLLGLAIAPTIAEVVMWLYETYNIWINVMQHTKNGEGIYFESFVKAMCFSGYSTPTEAYEAAIEYTLNNLI